MTTTVSTNLTKRILTAAVGVPLILGIIIFGDVEGTALFSWVISAGMLWEFSKMFLHRLFLKKALGLQCFNLIAHFTNWYYGTGMSPNFLAFFPFLFFFASFMLMTPELLKGATDSGSDSSAPLTVEVHELFAVFFGWVYCGWIPLLLTDLRAKPLGLPAVLFLLFVVWASDTGAYFAGKKFGKCKLFPAISPKKTWEGALGGWVLAVTVAFLVRSIYLPSMTPWTTFVLATLLVVAEVLGDLCESFLKRSSQVKDSGSILPGHGGFLDRFDGVLFSIPVLYAFFWLLRN